MDKWMKISSLLHQILSTWAVSSRAINWHYLRPENTFLWTYIYSLFHCNVSELKHCSFDNNKQALIAHVTPRSPERLPSSFHLMSVCSCSFVSLLQQKHKKHINSSVRQDRWRFLAHLCWGTSQHLLRAAETDRQTGSSRGIFGDGSERWNTENYWVLTTVREYMSH